MGLFPNRTKTQVIKNQNFIKVLNTACQLECLISYTIISGFYYFPQARTPQPLFSKNMLNF